MSHQLQVGVQFTREGTDAGQATFSANAPCLDVWEQERAKATT